MELYFLLERLKKEVLKKIKERPYLLADTRVYGVTLYDHLALTAGIAVAMAEEMKNRSFSTVQICGVDLPDEDFRSLVAICGFLHDIGKVFEGKLEYRRHVERGVEYARGIFNKYEIEEELLEVILNTIARHHLRNNPESILEKIICLADSYASAGDRPELGNVETMDDLERLSREILELEDELFNQKKPICLLLGDVDTIKNYVYETNILPEIRGGSELLREAEDEIKKLFNKRLTEEALIYCGGGSFLGIVPASEAETFKELIEKIYLNKTKIATITVISSKPIGYIKIARGLSPYDDARIKALSGDGVAHDLLISHYGKDNKRNKRKNFGELVTYLTGKLQQAKRQKKIVPFIEAFPVHKRCESCGKRPAIYEDPVRNEFVCFICEDKRKKGRERKRSFILDFFERWLEKKYNMNLCNKLQERKPENLNKLGDAQGKIALLYADGNNMGELLQKATSPATYRHISEALNIAIRDSLFEAFEKVFGLENLLNSETNLPFEIITLGGDDIIVILPGDAGWSVSISVITNFSNHPKILELQNEISARTGDDIKITISSGLAIADVKYPIRFLFDLANGLLKEAKRLAREKQTGTICHLWLRSPIISEDAKEVLDALYKYSDKQPSCYLTARPYTLEQAISLSDLAVKLSTISSAQRHTLAEALEKGVFFSLNYALYQIVRAKERSKELLETFEKLGSLVDTNNFNNRLLFWQIQKDEWRTALLDALELIELNAYKFLKGGVINGNRD